MQEENNNSNKKHQDPKIEEGRDVKEGKTRQGKGCKGAKNNDF